MNRAPIGLEPSTFLRDVWQKQPCLLRGAFPDFSPPLDADDLAGLACEALAEARIVSGSFPLHDWEVSHGPFEESVFAGLPETDWTLLVQDVEKHYPPLQEWMRLFHFLPSWRLDDLMVSFAAPGGSVGPHVDQYDVFLLQAEGRRRWQIATNFDAREVTACDLKVLEHFEAEQEWTLEPGDMLYLPPGIAHHGVALEAGMTWSFGFRAPSAADLLQAFGESLAFESDQGGRFLDPPSSPFPPPGEISAASLDAFRELMGSALADEIVLAEFIAGFMSRFRMAHAPAAPPTAVDRDTVRQLATAGVRLVRHPWTRTGWVRRGDTAVLYASGERFECDARFAEWICSLPSGAPPALLEAPGNLDTLVVLCNSGHVLFEAEEKD